VIAKRKNHRVDKLPRNSQDSAIRALGKLGLLQILPPGSQGLDIQTLIRCLRIKAELRRRILAFS
jgi:hypothetical protein